MIARAAAVVGGLVVVVGALWLSLWVLLFSAYGTEAPNPFVPDGDPCCGHPDTWGDVFGAIGAMLAGAAIVGSALALGAALLWFGLRGRWPRRRTLTAVPAAAVALTAAIVAIALIPQIDDAVVAPDCDEFRFDAAQWRAGGEERRDQALGIDRCGTLDGRRKRDVERLLGRREPMRDESGGRWPDGQRQTFWSYPELTVIFRGHRVHDTWLESFYAPD